MYGYLDRGQPARNLCIDKFEDAIYNDFPDDEYFRTLAEELQLHLIYVVFEIDMNRINQKAFDFFFDNFLQMSSWRRFGSPDIHFQYSSPELAGRFLPRASITQWLKLIQETACKIFYVRKNDELICCELYKWAMKNITVPEDTRDVLLVFLSLVSIPSAIDLFDNRYNHDIDHKLLAMLIACCTLKSDNYRYQQAKLKIRDQKLMLMPFKIAIVLESTKVLNNPDNYAFLNALHGSALKELSNLSRKIRGASDPVTCLINLHRSRFKIPLITSFRWNSALKRVKNIQRRQPDYEISMSAKNVIDMNLKIVEKSLKYNIDDLKEISKLKAFWGKCTSAEWCNMDMFYCRPKQAYIDATFRHEDPFLRGERLFKNDMSKLK